MSFGIRESSRSLGEPISLFFVRYGETPDAYFAYTDAEQIVTIQFDPDLGDVSFLPVPISFGEITASGSLDKASVEMRMPQNTPLADLFKLHPPSQVITLKVFQGHGDEDDYKVAWIGRILGGGREENEAVYTCEPVSTSMKRPGLRRNYQYQCPHVLYGPQCQANRAAATISRAVTAVAGALVSIGGTFANPDNYNGGIASWTTPDGRLEERTIVKRADTTTLIMSGVVVGLVVGQQIQLAFGCDHRLELAGNTLTGDCIDLHNNVLNYGGDLWIPLKNPIGIVNNFY